MTVVLSMIVIPSQNRLMASSGPYFTSGENVGLFLLAGMSAISATAIIGLLSYIAVSCTPPALRVSIEDRTVSPQYSAVCILPGSSRRWRIGGPTGVYFLNQLGWDLVQATGESRDDGDDVVF
jgi:hypothetical protein